MSRIKGAKNERRAAWVSGQEAERSRERVRELEAALRNRP